MEGSCSIFLSVKPRQVRCDTVPSSYVCALLYPKHKLIAGEVEGSIIKTEHQGLHGLIQTAHLAFTEHLHLILTPDDLLIPLIQALSFITREKDQGSARLQLSVEKSPDKSWPDVFMDFHEKIAQHVGSEKVARYSARFSTTGTYQAIAYDVALLDAYQNRFSYRTFSFCGIPSITLMGTRNDWILFEKKVQDLSRLFSVENWTQEICKKAKEILHSFENPKSLEAFRLWESFYKYQEGSGGVHITGWINLFFPIVSNEEGTKVATTMKDITGPPFGREMDSYFGSMSSAPAIHEDLMFGTTQKLRYCAGQLGAMQTKEGAVIPAWAWAVLEE